MPALPVPAFPGALVVTATLYRIATRGGRTSIAMVLLGGLAIGALAGALTGLLVFVADDRQLRDLTFWTLGSLAGATWTKVATLAPFLLDEPVAALDLRHQLDIAEAMRRHAARSGAVVAVLHDLNLAARVADRILVLDRGRLVADGPPHATITDAMLAPVFRIERAVGRVPLPGTPFALPHAMSAAGVQAPRRSRSA